MPACADMSEEDSQCGHNPVDASGRCRDLRIRRHHGRVQTSHHASVGTSVALGCGAYLLNSYYSIYRQTIDTSAF